MNYPHAHLDANNKILKTRNNILMETFFFLVMSKKPYISSQPVATKRERLKMTNSLDSSTMGFVFVSFSLWCLEWTCSNESIGASYSSSCRFTWIYKNVSRQNSQVPHIRYKNWKPYSVCLMRTRLSSFRKSIKAVEIRHRRSVDEWDNNLLWRDYRD